MISYQKPAIYKYSGFTSLNAVAQYIVNLNSTDCPGFLPGPNENFSIWADQGHEAGIHYCSPTDTLMPGDLVYTFQCQETGDQAYVWTLNRVEEGSFSCPEEMPIREVLIFNVEPALPEECTVVYFDKGHGDICRP